MVWLFFADGTEEIEALTVVDLLRRGGVEVLIAKVGEGRTATGSHDIVVTCDCNEAELDFNAFPEAVVLPGGMPGTKHLAASETVQSALRQAKTQERLIAAICAAPSVLGQAGLLVGKKATCFPGFENKLTGAEVTALPVQEDGRILTSRGMGTSVPFGLALLRALKGKEIADKVETAVQWRENLK